ncbi:D-amino acid aminotransferase [Kangiella sediminilitoris]|uniref:Aminodeoxychorismate lyase n=1 Tax=Kangiella sediminilitoris TaxID=1144748 RepID=A0A1B3BDD3_9GAMM|nr:D-amino acid aminotransferase [Kangiella sediminilitoris]AOE50778.1 D-amino-acid transaminase [Kangiella sediminilitoris]
MSVAYLNGHYVDLEQAKVPVLDRGFLFGDGIYEVIPVYAGNPFRLTSHINRLRKSLAAIYMSLPQSDDELKTIIGTLIEKNPYDNASVYLQITRGVYVERHHDFPEQGEATVFAMISPLPPVQKLSQATEIKGYSVITAEDIRWQRCDIKAITLLANCMLKQKALESGADDTILVRNGEASEATSSNLFIVRDGVIITPPLSEHLLAGVTREFILLLANQHGIPYEERPIPEHELELADEIWLTSSTKEIRPVVKVNDVTIGSGQPGSVWRQMYEYYQVLKERLYLGEISGEAKL